MARIELAPELAGDFERILAHLARHHVGEAPARVAQIVEAISVLEHSPLIGRASPSEVRELVIGHRARGYVALYRYVAEVDTVFVLAVRSQREAGYTGG